MQTIKGYKYKLIFIITFFILFCTFTTTVLMAEEPQNISINKTVLKQGEILIIKTSDSNPAFQVIFNNQKHVFNIYNNKKIALIPISYWTNTGNYTIVINSNNNTIEKDIKITSGNFDNSYLEVDKEQEELVRPENKETVKRKKEDQQLVNKARNTSSKDKLWTGKFIWPVEGIVSTDFGATRYVNGSLQSRHSGIDIACEKGKNISATNTGVVRLANNLLVTGNTIIIDHGWNVFSSYSHLSKINVEVGEKVNKGQKIGEIGSTGFSTGPHLHWTITIGRVFINPRRFIEEDLLKLENNQ